MVELYCYFFEKLLYHFLFVQFCSVFPPSTKCSSLFPRSNNYVLNIGCINFFVIYYKSISNWTALYIELLVLAALINKLPELSSAIMAS